MIRVSALLILLPLLAACGDLTKGDPRLGHPIGVEMRNLHADLEPEIAVGLTEAQIGQVRSIAEEAQKRAAGPATVTSEDPAWRHRIAEELRRSGAGQVIEAAGEGRGASIDMPVWQAKAPECGDFGVFGFNPDYDNEPNLNWGCSLQHNRAAMVQNPADLFRARTSSGRDGNRSADVLDKYGHGQATGSAAEAAGNTSTTSSAGSH